MVAEDQGFIEVTSHTGVVAPLTTGQRVEVPAMVW